ncbi:MAG: polyprenyl synthetase family protein [Coraliomargaritaceae bacterium]
MQSAVKEKTSQYRDRVESGIQFLLPPAEARPHRLHAAMRHSMEAGGKRIRPVLLLAAAEIFPSHQDPIPAAVAIECLHTYTLIHDDLPALDDSDLRRGRPSCHKQFDEPTAILAGDALLTLAFGILADAYDENPVLSCKLIQILAQSAGSTCLIGGQQEDIENEGRIAGAETLRYIHENKTAALISAAIRMGLLFAQPSEEQLQVAEDAGKHIGLCFQIIDDILDATSTVETMGKPVGNDAATGKNTYVALHGIETARTMAHDHVQKSLDLISHLGGNNEYLLQLIQSLEERIH